MPTAPTPGYAALGERANAQLKYWRILHKSASAHAASTDSPKAIRVLQNYGVTTG